MTAHPKSDTRPAEPRGTSEHDEHLPSEASLIRAFEDAPIGIAILDDQGLPIRINQALQRFLGYSCEEFRALTISDTSFPEDVERSSKLMRRLYGGEIDSYRFEKRYRCKDGSVVWAAIDVSRLRGRTSNAERAVAYLRNITAEKVEEVARTRRQRFERLVGTLATSLVNVPLPQINDVLTKGLGDVCELIGLDRAGVVRLEANRDIRIVLQWARPGLPLVVGDFSDAAGWFAQQLQASGFLYVTDVLEHPGIPPTSGEQVVSQGIRAFLGVPLLSETHSPSFLGFGSANRRAWEPEETSLLQISAEVVASALRRKDAETELEHSERRTREVAANLPQQFWIMKRDPLEVVYSNPEFDRFWHFGAACGAQEERSTVEICPEDLPRCAERVIEAFASPKDLDFRVHLPGGEQRWLRSRMFPIPDSSGVAVRVAGITEDITEQRRAQEASRYRADLETLINRLATSFMNVSTEGIDGAIESALSALGAFAGVEICYLALFDYKPYDREVGWAWVAREMESYRDAVLRVRLDDYPWYKQQLLQLRDLHVTGPEEFPPEAVRERADSIAGGLRLMHSVPVLMDGRAVGHLSLNAIIATPRWTAETMAPLRVVAEVLAAALERRRAELELRHQAAFDHLISELSGKFINVPAAEIEPAIHDALAKLGEFAGADRATIVLFGNDGTTIGSPHEWCAPGVPSPKEIPLDPPASRFPWLAARAFERQIVHTPDVDQMPPEAAVEMAALQALGIRSRLQVPVVSSSGVLGMLAFSSLQRGYSWNPATASLMQIAGEMFGNAIQRRLADEEIRNGEAFARLSTELATGFINLPLERLDAGIEAAIRAIAEFCGADRALITRIEQSDRFVSVTHEWCADGLPRLGERLREMPAEAFPWMLEQIRTLDLVAASRLEDLPVHAVWEREFIRALGCRSGIALSLLSRNRVVTGAIQLFCVRERQWPDSAIAAVRLASGVLSNAIERRQTEAEARKHQSELAHVLRVGTMGELASGILHDVKQPLAAIAFYSRGCEERVKRGEMDGDELQAMFGRLTSLAVRTGAVVKQVREYVRREPEARKRHNLNDLIRRAVALVQPDAEQNRVSLRLNLTRKQLPVDVNPVQIEQVMINLLINGVEAIGQTTERSGEIRIETRPTEDDQAEVAVTDCGIGLPPADRLPNVFEPFVTTKHEGLGLGLAISRSLIESHGGQIWGRSRDDRRGATFGFTVPLSRG